MKPKLAFLSVRLLKRLIVPTLSVRHNVKQNLIQKSMIAKKNGASSKKNFVKYQLFTKKILSRDNPFDNKLKNYLNLMIDERSAMNISSAKMDRTKKPSSTYSSFPTKLGSEQRVRLGQ